MQILGGLAMLTVYGANWCPDTHRARAVLDERGVVYRFVDVDADPRGRDHVVAVVGKLKIPLLEFPDGTRMVVPFDHELRAKLGHARAS
jgi:glutaredoxin